MDKQPHIACVRVPLVMGTRARQREGGAERRRRTARFRLGEKPISSSRQDRHGISDGNVGVQAVEESDKFLLVERVGLTKGKQGGRMLDLSISLATYFNAPGDLLAAQAPGRRRCRARNRPPASYWIRMGSRLSCLYPAAR